MEELKSQRVRDQDGRYKDAVAKPGLGASPTMQYECSGHLKVAATEAVDQAYKRGSGVSGSARRVSALVSGVMSRCGIPSSSKPTMNLRTVAERSSGGKKCAWKCHSGWSWPSVGR